MLAHGVRQPVLLVAGTAGASVLAARPRLDVAAPMATLAAFTVPPVALSRQVPMLGDGPNSIAMTLTLLLAVFFIGTGRNPRTAVAGLAVVLAFCALYAVGPGAPSGSSGNDMLAAFLFSGVLPWLAGFAVAWQQRARAADRLVEQTRTAAALERTRIAREVHDLVAHTVSMMVVQAEAAEAMMPTAPQRSAESLQAVQHAGRTALAEMRRTLAALRAGDVGTAAPTLDQLPALLDTMRTAGVPIEVVVEGTPCAVPDEIDKSAYRVVQEALTNVLRHSDHTGALVRIAYGVDTVTVSVVDQGRPVRRRLPGGHGLAGLRERVGNLGGTLDAGPAHDGRHVVHATLPIAAAR
jgi:signal transduction histidine kinase